MKKLKRVVCVLSIVAAVFDSAPANNIALSNIHLTGRNTTAGVNNVANYAMVQFDISWENSWRTSTAAPYNSDAAWVFIKYKVAGGDGQWRHAVLNGTGSTAPSGSTITPATDGTGAFIYPDASGSGAFSKTGLQLRWNYGASGVADNATVDVRVFAIEMVFIPTGPFVLGSGGGESGSFYKSPTGTDVYLVNSESAVTIGTPANNLYYTNTAISGDQAGPLPAEFPKGYQAFYCMKYEISQQGYVDFLNTLEYTQQAARTTSTPSSVAGTGALVGDNLYRNGIDIMTPGVGPTTPAVYACNGNGNAVYNEVDDGQNIACNYLSWSDVAAYLDWCGLRPMTEFEFEKACRGTTTARASEYAWGNETVLATDYTIGGVAGTNTEIVNNPAGDTTGNSNYSKTVGTIGGPLRVGCFASGGSNRPVSGATYYGIMEMSGNVWERAITVGNPNGRVFTGTHGNGALDAAGNADVSAWPGGDAIGAGFRGGGWTGYELDLRTSDRVYAAASISGRGDQSYGGRGVRTAMYDNLASDPLMVPVVGGTFQMGNPTGYGSDIPVHSVTVGSFYIDKYEITYEKWTEVRSWALTHGYTDLTAGQNGSTPHGANNPVTMVSWYDVVKWCNARSEMDGLTPAYYTSNTLATVYRTGQLDLAADAVKWTTKAYRLPTEAEWEFAARGGHTGTYTYSGSNTVGDVAWYIVNSGGSHTVGTKLPNELGIFDMSGNAWEWCWDWHGNYPSGAQTDPKGVTSGSYRISRGASFANNANPGCRVDFRYNFNPSWRDYDYGFRCVER